MNWSPSLYQFSKFSFQNADTLQYSIQKQHFCNKAKESCRHTLHHPKNVITEKTANMDTV